MTEKWKLNSNPNLLLQDRACPQNETQPHQANLGETKNTLKTNHQNKTTITVHQSPEELAIATANDISSPHDLEESTNTEREYEQKQLD